MKTFNDLGLAAPLLRALSDENYDTPTPIQADVIPAFLSGRDVVGIAQTGTGKTASFVLPLLHRIAEQKTKAAPKTCGALILTPTRELAQQIAVNIKTYAKFMRVSVIIVVGGVKPFRQIRSLASGADIVIATPGRLLDHMSTGAVKLDQTTSIVLDEGDQMLDLGFMPAIRKIMAALPSTRQTVLMSATMPKQIRALANAFLNDPAEIAVAVQSRPIERIAQSVRHVTTAEKRDVLVEILKGAGPDARAIVFTRTKRGADKVTRYLGAQSLSAAAIHGNKSQSQRQRTLAAFRAGDTAILVATDIAARGIDIDDVTHVVNFDLPHVAEAYVHRIGRTARAGRSGVAVSLCGPDDRPLLRAIERLIGTRLSTDFADDLARETAIDLLSDDDPVPQLSKPKSSQHEPRPDGAKTGDTHKPRRKRRRAQRGRKNPNAQKSSDSPKKAPPKSGSKSSQKQASQKHASQKQANHAPKSAESQPSSGKRLTRKRRRPKKSQQGSAAQ